MKDQGHMLKFALEKNIFFSGEFPHLVLITRDGAIGTTIVCTGSLISEKAVVTAGHCCDGYESILSRADDVKITDNFNPFRTSLFECI